MINSSYLLHDQVVVAAFLVLACFIVSWFCRFLASLQLRVYFLLTSSQFCL